MISAATFWSMRSLRVAGGVWWSKRAANLIEPFPTSRHASQNVPSDGDHLRFHRITARAKIRAQLCPLDGWMGFDSEEPHREITSPARRVTWRGGCLRHRALA